MTIDDIRSKIVKHGIMIYVGVQEYDVYICESHILYGTGDYEDDPEVANDREVDCYAVYYSDMQKKNLINASAGQFKSLEKAIEIIECSAGFLHWSDV